MFLSLELFITCILCWLAVKAEFNLMVLHTNDMHSQFEQINSHRGTCREDAKNCYGGFARVKRAFLDSKHEANKSGYEVIFLNAGDTFQGSALYTLHKATIVGNLLNTLEFDVMSLGNHEFDDGVDNLVTFLKISKTPVVASNVNLTSDARLIPFKNLTKSFVKIFGETKVGVIGYLTPSTKFISKTEDVEIYDDEIPSIQKEAKRLKKEGVNIIIALGHSGFDRDKEIAEAIPEISMVIGGHSHTFLYTPPDQLPDVEEAAGPYPYWVKQKSGKMVPIVQAYCYTKYLGKLRVTFDDNGDVIKATGNPILLDNTVPKDRSVELKVSQWIEDYTKKQLKSIPAHTRTFLRRQRPKLGLYESNLADLVTDALLDYGVKYSVDTNTSTWTIGTIAIIQNGGMRVEFDNKYRNGEIREEDVYSLLPFKNELYVAEYKGSTIRKALEHGVSKESYREEKYKFFLYASGLEVIYDFSEPSGRRVKFVSVLCKDCEIPHYDSLRNDKVYSVILSSYLLDGGDNFTMLKDEALKIVKMGSTDTDAFLEYLKKHQIVYPGLDGRIVVENTSISSSTSTFSRFSILVSLIYTIYTAFK